MSLELGHQSASKACHHPYLDHNDLEAATGRIMSTNTDEDANSDFEHLRRRCVFVDLDSIAGGHSSKNYQVSHVLENLATFGRLEDTSTTSTNTVMLIIVTHPLSFAQRFSARIRQIRHRLISVLLFRLTKICSKVGRLIRYLVDMFESQPSSTLPFR